MHSYLLGPRLAEDQFFKDIFDRTGNHTVPWRSYAGDLFAASEALWSAYRTTFALKDGDPMPNEMRFFGPALLLRGAGIECLLKAVALTRGFVLAKEGKFVKPKNSKHRPPSTVESHDLVGLSEAISFETSESERDLLRRLSLFITAGRYPIQTTWNKGLVLSSAGGGDKVQSLYWGGFDDTTFIALRDRLNGLFPALNAINANNV